MSHISMVDVEIKDLAALEAACARLGLEFRRGQQSYRWHGNEPLPDGFGNDPLLDGFGNDPLPGGFVAEDLGKCDHAIAVPDNERAYEIGVVKRRDGRPGHVLLWDFWRGGYGLQQMVGENAKELVKAYAVEAARRELQRHGYTFTERVLADGTIECRATKVATTGAGLADNWQGGNW